MAYLLSLVYQDQLGWQEAVEDATSTGSGSLSDRANNEATRRCTELDVALWNLQPSVKGALSK